MFSIAMMCVTNQKFYYMTYVYSSAAAVDSINLAEFLIKKRVIWPIPFAEAETALCAKG